MKPAELAALEQFKEELSDLDKTALLDRWIAHRDNSNLSELDAQKELCLEVALAAKFGLTKWRKAVQNRRKTIRDANRE